MPSNAFQILWQHLDWVFAVENMNTLMFIYLRILLHIIAYDLNLNEFLLILMLYIKKHQSLLMYIWKNESPLLISVDG